MSTRQKEIEEIYQEIDQKRNLLWEHWRQKKISDQSLQAFTFVRHITIKSNKSLRKPFSCYGFRKFMVEVAALAIAAVEWTDRREKSEGDFRSY